MSISLNWRAALLLIGFFVASALLPAQSSNEIEISGLLSATDQEAQEGYFAIGNGTMLMLKPKSGARDWLAEKRGNRVKVRITLDPEPTTN